ncbi:uncharacterized protein BT62DRAFT_617552 [Guyanagaster necrorhizus]|uniref:F-box domain-containing protein n=1 Tax=Guyanagaster necrorhizus TaxID=856835 RepID=A0A9P7W061_9AGAR|nr:uncharacterized protein BT62DRAFT_617552 [Guyanagaster necrorhizus MCA 3950]KAG7449965.1 hypothetical protein BT62DRAFT_617552 [Guyanagaster necrorhizus MCA 3950]
MHGSESPMSRCPQCGFGTTIPRTRLTDTPSPFQHLISVNAAASDVDPIHHYLQGVHDEIQHIELVLKEVREEKIRLQNIADSHAALMSAFRKFPSEVLAEVFRYSIDIPSMDEQNKWVGDMTRVYTALCTLGGVCRHWRTTVLLTPFLWARFNVGWSGWKKSPVLLLKTMLDRSREADLSIGCAFIASGIDKQERRTLLECLVPTSYRWKHVLLLFDEDNVDIWADSGSSSIVGAAGASF